MYDAVADDYCYPGTTVLKNKLDLRDASELADFEAEVSDTRSDEEVPNGNLDFTHFKAIHHHLFQDVYDWAGQARFDLGPRSEGSAKRRSLSQQLGRHGLGIELTIIHAADRL